MACIHLEIITWLFGDTDHLGIHIITDNVLTLLEIHVNFVNSSIQFTIQATYGLK